jgi:hypothetical protein
MATKIHCPQCKANMLVPEQLLGKKLCCPRCQGVVSTLAPRTAGPAVARAKDPVAQGVTAAPPALPGAAAVPAPLEPEPPLAELVEEPVALGSLTPGQDARPSERRRKRKSTGLLEGLGLPTITLGDGVVRTALLFVVVVVAGLGGFFGLRAAFRTPARAEIPEGLWQPFEAPGRCKVLFPGIPKTESQSIAGMQMVMHSAQPDNDSVFGIGYTEGDLPPHRRNLPAEALLNDSCDGSAANISNMGGKEVSRRSIQLGNFPGKELVMYVARAPGHMISRCYLVGGRLYVIMCGGKGYDPGQKNVQRFFDSLEILDSGEPAPPAPVAQPPAPGPARRPPTPPAGPVARNNRLRRSPARARPAPVIEAKPVAVPPARPEMPQAARLELPPLPEPIDIRPAPVQAETPYRLPEPVRAVRIGGGGRFLILHFPESRKLGVFDANEAKVVRYIPLSEDDVHFAAGMTKLMVYLAGSKVLQRYSLLTGQRERVGRLEQPDGKIEAFCMGHASAGPLLVGVAGAGAQLFDPETFQPIALPPDERGGAAIAPGRLEGGNYWAGATGRVFGHTGNYGMPNGVKTVVLESTGVRNYGVHQGTWFVMPGPDGHHVYAAGHGIVTEQVTPVANVPFSMGPGSGQASHLYLPAHHGPYYLHAQTMEDFAARDKTTVGTVRVYMLGDSEPIATFGKTAVCKYGWDGLRGLGIEYSIHLIPKAKLLVIVPGSRDELRLYPADLDAALDKLGRDYLLFTSSPPHRFQKGKAFAYRPEVKARKGPVKLTVESGPAGMTVDGTGSVCWAVPADFAERRVDVILAARDANGQEAFQTLTLTAEGPE